MPEPILPPVFPTHVGMNRRFHTCLKEPVVFDCRMKPWYPPVLEVDGKIGEMGLD